MLTKCLLEVRGRSMKCVLSRFIVDMSAPVAVFQFGDWLR
jgi:hypothetical protein